jgi:hypothetical protein
VGGRVDGGELLGRARAAQLLGAPVRLLDPSDELLYLLVHAAKHGACAPKWLLDLYVVTQGFDAWETLVERARAAGVTRPAWAAARLVAELPGAPVPAAVLSSLRPALLGRLFTQALERVGGEPPDWERYARELVLEESLLRRLRMVGGAAERLLNGLTRFGLVACAGVCGRCGWCGGGWRGGSSFLAVCRLGVWRAAAPTGRHHHRHGGLSPAPTTGSDTLLKLSASSAASTRCRRYVHLDSSSGSDGSADCVGLGSRNNLAWPWRWW